MRHEQNSIYLNWNPFFLKIHLYAWYTKVGNAGAFILWMVLFIFLRVARKHGIYYFCFSFSVVGCFFFNPKNGISFILCCLHWISLRTMYYVIWHQAVFPRLIEDQRLGIFGCTIFFFIVVLIITVFQSRYRQICSLLLNESLGDSSSMNKLLCLICSQLNDFTELNPIWKLNFTFLVVIIFNFLCVQHINY